MWKEMVFEPEVEKYGEPNATGGIVIRESGMVIRSAKDLMLEFLNKERINKFRIVLVYNDFIGYHGDTTCYQIFYYDSSVYRPAREI